MKWTNIKNIMIYFLLAMNIFMLAFIAVDTYRQSVIPDDVLDAALEVINESGFECDRKTLPSRYYNRSPLDATFYSASDLSDLFFGKQVAFRTSDRSLVAMHEGATLTVYSNYFVYDSGATPQSTSSKKLQDALEKLGIDMENSVYDKDTGCFYKMYNGSNLFNMYIEAKTDNNGEICRISAQWPKALSAHDKEKISFIESMMKLKAIFPEGGKIEKIELGYALISIGGEKYRFTPAWRVNVNGELKILE